MTCAGKIVLGQADPGSAQHRDSGRPRRAKRSDVLDVFRRIPWNSAPLRRYSEQELLEEPAQPSSCCTCAPPPDSCPEEQHDVRDGSRR